MQAVNNFFQKGDLAILRADWLFIAQHGCVLALASSAAIIRQQA